MEQKQTTKNELKNITTKNTMKEVKEVEKEEEKPKPSGQKLWEEFVKKSVSKPPNFGNAPLPDDDW